MKTGKGLKLMSLATIIIIGIVNNSSGDALAKESSYNTNGEVNVKDKIPSDILDPEDHDTIVIPDDPSPSTKGSLRIDHVSSLNFGTVKIKKTKRNYSALPVTFKNTDMKRGNFIQITDRRSHKSGGWTLQVKQENQFISKDYDELNGAQLSLDKAWANNFDMTVPLTVTRDTLELSNIGQAYEVARAEKETAKGVWSIEFGASGENKHGQENTLKEEPTSDGKGMILKNQAIKLLIPDKTVVAPKEYQTQLTWILGETP